MRTCQRFRAVAALAVALAGLAVAFARPLLLVGAAGVGGWLLARQYTFVRVVAAVERNVSVTQSLADERCASGEEVTVTLEATASEPLPAEVVVRAEPPVVATVPDPPARSVRLDATDLTGATSFSISVPVAGTYSFSPATIEVRDALGLFWTEVSKGETPTLTVESRATGDLHVGKATERTDVGYGEHRGDRTGSGLSPAEVREYVPGDPMRHVDWRATARFGHPHVREFEAETDRGLGLVVDRRARMAAGPPGETKFDYVRQVALALVRSTQRHADPLGLYEVTDEGVAVRRRVSATSRQYDAVRERLHRIRATEGADDSTASARLSPAAVRRTALALRDDDSAFGIRLRPFFECVPQVERSATDPLVEAVRAQATANRAAAAVAILTDDTAHTPVREAIQIARSRGLTVLVFLAPTALYGSDGNDYEDFEAFRRELDGLAGVSAFEVAPRSRVEAFVDRRTRASTGGEP